MRSQFLTTLSLIALMATPALAQEETTEAPAEEAMEADMAEEMAEEMAEDVMEDAMAEEVVEDMVEEMAEEMAEDAADTEMADDTTEDAMAEEAMEAEMADDAMEADVAEEAMETDMAEDGETETPSLEEIAASDPALDVRTNEEGEVDAMVMLSDVLFAFGDASLQPAALDVLAGVAQKLDGVPSIEITGHTDAVGDADFNLALGQRRADTVRDWLIANTPLTADVITASSAGEEDPIAANDTSDNRALNRRVEFTLPDAG